MKELHDWFQENKRDFPWRVERTPYRVWISEVMLQQTRAAVVIPYFLRWMALFPNVKSLAEASLESVIKAWEGLGYYSRARNLHAAAKQISEQFCGEFPFDRKELETIRGLGPYTIGAILSFGFRKRAAAVDGNTTRVLSRYFCVEENVCKQATKRKIQELAENLLDEKEPWVTAEALIELGATICTPKPRCPDCPLQSNCSAYRQCKAALLPIKNQEPETVVLFRAVAIIESEGKILLRKGSPGQVMADLYEFPYFEMGDEKWGLRKLMREIKKNWGITVENCEKLTEVQHTFTRYKAHLFPERFQALKPISEIYRNGLKNREFDEKGLQNFCSERETIAERQGSSENKNFEVNPTKSKTDSSDYFGIDRMNFF